MIKLFSILFSFLILAQSVNVNNGDALQLDELVEHAQFHIQEYGDSFFVFIAKHYGDLKDEHHKKHQEEKSDHEELPFQQHSQLASVLVFIVDENPFEKQKLEHSDCSETNFYYQNTYSSIHDKGVFQPPKFA